MADDLESRFKRATERMRANTSLSLSNEHKLSLYGYYKQATEGQCKTKKPGFFDITGRAKWDSWHNLGDLAQQSAMAKYIAVVDQIDPRWDSEPLDQTKIIQSASSSGNSSVLGGPVVSRMAGQPEDELRDSQKNAFDWCKEGNIDHLKECVSPASVNTRDDQGMALLHWACDRGHLNVIEYLVQEQKADVNIKDDEEQTPLHYAASCGHGDAVKLLLTLGGDRTAKDANGEQPEDVCDSSVLYIFRNQS